MVAVLLPRRSLVTTDGADVVLDTAAHRDGGILAGSDALRQIRGELIPQAEQELDSVHLRIPEGLEHITACLQRVFVLVVPVDLAVFLKRFVVVRENLLLSNPGAVGLTAATGGLE